MNNVLEIFHHLSELMGVSIKCNNNNTLTFTNVVNAISHLFPLFLIFFFVFEKNLKQNKKLKKIISSGPNLMSLAFNRGGRVQEL